MKYCVRFIEIMIIFMLSNLMTFTIDHKGWILCALLLCYLILNIAPSIENRNMIKRRHRICKDGCDLLIIFLCSSLASAMYLLKIFPTIDWSMWIINLCIVVLCEAIVFWNGIIRIYVTSFQLGMKWRIIGIVCGWIPIAQFVALYYIIRIASSEATFENEKIVLNKKRENAQICATKYPILLVHGVFFRDFKYFNYWGRIPKQLEINGAKIYYGNHQSASSIKESAQELKLRILEILEESKSEKINIIAHSKGGLDCRYAISCLGMDDYVASLTTINTPHKGCIFADYLLHKIPDKVKSSVAFTYNSTLRKMGDANPDFLSSVTDLTASACEGFNEDVLNSKKVYYQSVGSLMNRARDGRFPLNFSMQLVKYFDGVNDGLVAETSFPWGDMYKLVTTKGNRGITHGDMIDLNRENIKDFDVREFYVNLVNELKLKGY